MDREIPIDPELEKGYNVSLSRDDFRHLFGVWASRSEVFRAGADAQLDCAYDQGSRDRLDLFRCGDSNAPLLVFIHGGYWQRGDKSVFSFIAEPFVETGVDVALIGYTLCPHTDIGSISDQIRKAIVWLWRNAKLLAISPERINITGHSAGAQLTGMMLATKWHDIDSDVPPDLLKAGIPISGLYQLEPLRHTTINHALRMDKTVAHINSPQFLQAATAAPILVTLGGAETSQFYWQMDQFVDQWISGQAQIETFVEPGVDHFDVINRLADSDSAIFGKVHDWLR